MTTTIVDDQVDVRFLTVFGCKIRVAIRPGDGTGTGIPLLMCNGLGVPLEVLAPLARTLSDRGVETITFDVPGTGQSPTPHHPYTMPMLAALTARLVKDLGYGKVDVFGLSWGGALAQQVAIQYPRRCRRLVLAAPMPGAPMIGRPKTLMKLATPRRYNDPAHAKSVAGDLYGGRIRNDPGLLRKPETRTSGRGYLFQQLAVAGWSGQPWLPALRQRTLILGGDDDPIVPLVNLRWLALLIPRSRLTVIHDGHYFFQTSMEETAEHIRAFLTRSRSNPQ